jgi:hypothetical protein
LDPVERGYVRPWRQQFRQGVVNGDYAPPDNLGEQGSGHRLGDGADFECCALIDRALGFRISAEIGSDRGTVFDDGRSDAGAGTVTLEALLECAAQLVFAGSHRRRLLKVLERGSEKVLSGPPAPLHEAIILSGRKMVEQAHWTAGSFLSSSVMTTPTRQVWLCLRKKKDQRVGLTGSGMDFIGLQTTLPKRVGDV